MDHGDGDNFEFRNGDEGGLIQVDGGREAEARGGDEDDEWWLNGLEEPSVTGVDPAYALSSDEGMSEEKGLVLSDSGRLLAAEYLVACAMPADHSITKVVGGEEHVLEGEYGLSPEWENDSCDEDCQQKVSACMLALTNNSQRNVQLWVESDLDEIGLGGRPAGLVREASFFGNLFVGESFYCEGEFGAEAAALEAGRTCSHGEGCGFTTYSNCQEFRCTMAGPDSDVPTDCKAGDETGLSDSYHTITTFLPEA